MHGPSATTGHLTSATSADGAFAIERQHRLEVRPDGSCVVLDVPVFAENTRELNGERMHFGKDWLQGALNADRARRATGYVAPVHFGHHAADGSLRERAGQLELTRLGLRSYDAQPTWVLYGNLVFPDRKTLDKVRSQYPYRSVEISFENAGEINSLALLSSEAPYFRFPNLQFTAAPDGTFAWRHKMDINDPSGALGAPAPAAPAPAAPANDATAASFAAAEGGLAKAASDGGLAKAEDAGMPAEGGEEMPGYAKHLLAAMSRMEAYMRKMSDADYAEGEPEVDAGNHEPVRGPSPSEAPRKGSPPVVAAAAKLDGEIAYLTGEVKALRKEAADRQLTEKLEKQLAPYGAKIGPNWRKILTQRILNGTAEAWASGIMQYPAPKAADPAPEAPAAAAAPPPADQDPPEVAKYKANPEKLAAARVLAASFNALSPGHFVRKQGLAVFLSTQPELERI